MRTMHNGSYRSPHMRFQSLLVAATLMGSLLGCTPDKHETSRAKLAPTQELFVDATESSGIRFHHFNGRTGEFYYPEIIGSGVALFDFNNDGKLDILVYRGRRWGLASKVVCQTNPVRRGSIAMTWW